MRYTEIVKYVRDGDFVTPVRVTKAHGITTVVPLSWSSLFGGHCDWIEADIKRRTARVNAKVAQTARVAA